MRHKIPVLAIVVPCYNEEAVIPETIKNLSTVLNDLISKEKIAKNSFIYLVDDGSKDRTWQIIEENSKENKKIFGQKLSRNCGHQNALLSGLLTVKDLVDCTISIDSDLQDDTSVIEQFIDEYKKGSEIVYGVRRERKVDSYFKKSSAQAFYKIMKSMGVEVVYNHADYRLASSKVLNDLASFGEVNLFLRGIFPLIGYTSSTVYYDRKKRFAGESKYPFKKMLSFAFDAVTSFSIKPLRIITTIGFIIFIGSLVAGIWALIEYLFGNTSHGWASIVLPIYFIGGIQLLSLGVIGEYIGKMYKETKHRPRYFLEKSYLPEEPKEIL